MNRLIVKCEDSSSSDSESNRDEESILPEISLSTSDDRSGLVVKPYLFHFGYRIALMINYRYLQPDPIKVKHILLQHQLNVITGANEEDMQPVDVRRKHIII